MLVAYLRVIHRAPPHSGRGGIELVGGKAMHGCANWVKRGVLRVEYIPSQDSGKQ